MAIVTPSSGQSSSAINGQSTTYLKGNVLQQVHSAPDTLVDTVIQNVLREFYTMSTGWREIIGPYPLSINFDTVQLNPVDQYSNILIVLDAWLFPVPSNSNTRQFLMPSPRKIVGTDKGQPSAYWLETPDIMHLYPVPNISYGQVLYVYASMKPVINTTQLPPIATEHHFDALVSGALARLYRMPDKPWTDKEAAMFYTKEFRRGISLWRDFANRGHSGKIDTPMIFPPFAGKYSQGSQRGARSSF